MDVFSLIVDLRLCSAPSTKPSPCTPLPPITEVLSALQRQLIGSADGTSDRCSLIGGLEQLFHAADPDWLFAPGNHSWAELQAVVHALIGCAAVPLCEDECASVSTVVNQNTLHYAAAVSSALSALLRILGKRQESHTLLPVLTPPIIVFAVSHQKCVEAALHLQEALLSAGCWTDSAHMLQDRGILGKVLDLLQPQLTRDTWWRCEATKKVFTWTLLQVTGPSLSPLLPRLLPPSLLFNDDYRAENCVMGVVCLHHIVLNMAAADLLHFNRAELIYQAVFKHLHNSESTVLQVVLPCLFDILLVLEPVPSSSALSSSRRKPCRHDDVLHLLLTHMEVEPKVSLRRIYASALPYLITRMGVCVCRHLQRVLRVLLSYLQVRDGPEETNTLSMLRALQELCRVAWPRMQPRAQAFLRPLLILLIDVSSNSELDVSVRRRLMEETLTAVRLLDVCSHGRIQSLLLQLDSSVCSSEVLGHLATVSMAMDR
ncbi:TELO2-interacting protein 2 isoform X1 [Gouania willdenowi]|uniref:TELO2-interacting protein 2 n=1 Tax=Gouania willdenowi TaxID=441366 RepID=A0A8C5E6V5_GOUWI|nr:TELO2-interacting protein 2 isoform X1 [Gouania willdenowi]XP_028314465.1 TELO2-interacting protein 2 isoform X1 [Gouania willdenowi]